MFIQKDPKIYPIKNYYFPEKIEMEISIIFKKLMENYGCTYMFVMYEDNFYCQRISYVSNPDWKEQFIRKKLIEHCQFRLECNRRFINPKINKAIIPWYTVPYKDREQRRVIVERRSYGIDNGISFSNKIGKIRETIGLGAELNNLDFPRVILLNITYVSQLILNIRRAALNYLQLNRLLLSKSIAKYEE